MWQPRNAAERKAADDAVRFIRHLRHTKGRWAGLPFDLRPWQEHEIVRPLFGTLNPDGKRQYRIAYVEVPKKQGKSEIAAGVGLKCLFADGEAAPEVYSAARDKDQASIVHNVAAQMTRGSQELKDRARIIDSTKRIVVTSGRSVGGFYRAIPGDAAGTDGVNPSCVVFDEIHRQPNRELWQVLTSSTAAREQPLTFGITTAGFDRESLCWDLHARALGLLKLRDPERYAWSDLPVAVEDDPTFFAVVYGVAEDADWMSLETAKQANPNFAITVPQAYYEQAIREAIDMPAEQNKYRRLHLNQWTGQETRWISIERWDQTRGIVPKKAPDVCYGGLDLSSRVDITAFVLVFPPEDPDTGPYRLISHFWLPKDGLQERMKRDSVPYDIWAASGFLDLTEGETVDHSAIRRHVQGERLRRDLREIAYDRWNIGNLDTDLDDVGIEMFGFEQTAKNYSWATKEFERLVLERRLHHDGNPLLRWMLDGVTLISDADGNVKPSKKKSKRRIDGVVAAVMALDRALRNGMQRSTYADRGIEFL